MFPDLLSLLNSPATQSFVGVVQIAVLIVMLRAVSNLSRMLTELHEWHSVKDPAHPGAFLWWSASLPDLVSKTDLISERMRSQQDKLGDVADRISELQDGQKQIVESQRQLSVVAVKAINQREHLVG